jgi:hypothetical protein
MKLLFPIVLFFCGACMNPQILTEDQQFKIMANNESDKIAAELGISPFGFGVKGPDGIQGITLSYTSKERLNLEQARQLIIRLAQKVPSRINNKISTENLNKCPVDLSFFYLSINFEGLKTLFNENDGEIARVVISRGDVIYNIRKPGVRGFTPIYSEPYEEAYRKVFGDSPL